MKRLIWIVAAVLVAAGTSAAVVANASPAPRYRLATAAVGDVAQTVAVSGTVDHVNRADVAFGTDGTVATLTVAPGDAVTAGQELGTLDTTELAAAVSRAQAQVSAAEDALAEDEAAQEEAAGRSDELRTARSEAAKALTAAAEALAAQEKACADPASPACTAAVTATRSAQEAVQRAQTALQSAIEAQASAPEGTVASEASVDDARATLVEAEQALAGATLTAPITGTVGAVTAAAGDGVAAGEAVVTVIGEGAAVVSAVVPLEQLRRLAVGQEAAVTPVGTSTTAAGTVTKVGTLPDPTAETVAYPVTITVADPPASMAAGSTATATITITTAKDVLTVPTSAVRRGVVTVLSDEHPSPTRVTVGAVGPARTEIKEGLTAGDQVVLADLDSPIPTNDQQPGPTEGFMGGVVGSVRVMRPGN